MEPIENIEMLKRYKLKQLHAQLTPEQVKIFNLMYKSIDKIKDKNVSWAIEQCERTVESNNKS